VTTTRPTVGTVSSRAVCRDIPREADDDPSRDRRAAGRHGLRNAASADPSQGVAAAEGVRSRRVGH
jgi:hypothetical protein